MKPINKQNGFQRLIFISVRWSLSRKFLDKGSPGAVSLPDAHDDFGVLIAPKADVLIESNFLDHPKV
jgi:hypothetical protein